MLNAERRLTGFSYYFSKYSHFVSFHCSIYVGLLFVNAYRAKRYSTVNALEGVYLLWPMTYDGSSGTTLVRNRASPSSNCREL